MPTPPGVESKILALEPNHEDNLLAWALARPLFDVPKLNGVKPGATVLATLSSQANPGQPYPLIAWQRYGDGKTMFVASDQLWRLRFKHSDAYHAHYWSQAIQFLTLARLMGKNKRIHLETDRVKYNTTERVLIQGRLLDNELGPLEKQFVPSYPVLVEQVPAQGEPKLVLLKPVLGLETVRASAGLLHPRPRRRFPRAAPEGQGKRLQHAELPDRGDIARKARTGGSPRRAQEVGGADRR